MPTDRLEGLETWLKAGWLRPIDYAFAVFLQRQDPQGDGLVLLAAALASYQYGKGHICLDLAKVLANPAHVFGRQEQPDTATTQPIPPLPLLDGINLAGWLAALGASDLVGHASSHRPLTLDHGQLYLTRNWVNEQTVATAINRRSEVVTSGQAEFKARLDALFPSSQTGMTQPSPDWQKIACALATQGRILIITGGPGTGKTFTVVRLLALLQGGDQDKLRILLAAPTGKAAARLTESIADAMASLPDSLRDRIPSKAMTLHQLLGSRKHSRHFRYNQEQPLQADVVVVDEASMIDLEMMAALLNALPDSTRLVLVGDKDQLASVEAGSVLGDLCKNLNDPWYSPETTKWIKQFTGESLEPSPQPTGALAQQTVMLRTSKRFGEHSGIGQLARAINAGDQVAVSNIIENTQYEDLHWLPKHALDAAVIKAIGVGKDTEASSDTQALPPPAVVTGYHAYLKVMQSSKPKAGSNQAAWEDWCHQVLRAFGSFQILCALREGPWGVKQVNEKIAQALRSAALIDQEQQLWYGGRPVMMMRNDYELGIMNGDIGIALKLPDETGKLDSETMKVVFRNADGSLRFVLPSRLSSVETVFAMTIHKSQGSEFGHVVLILPDAASNPIMTRELVYTGITRAKYKITVIAAEEQHLRDAVGKTIERSGRLGALVG